MGHVTPYRPYYLVNLVNLLLAAVKIVILVKNYAARFLIKLKSINYIFFNLK